MKQILPLILALLLLPTTARGLPCPKLTTTLDARDVFPAKGTTAVPTNTDVLILYKYGQPQLDFTDVRLRGAGTSAFLPVAVSPFSGAHKTATLITIRPQQPLPPATQVEVLDRYPTVPCSFSNCSSALHTVFASFTTGNGPDKQPPTFAGMTASWMGEYCEVCPMCADCCGPWSIIRLGLWWKEAVDDTTPPQAMRYRVYHQSTGEVLAVVVGDTQAVGIHNCAFAYPFDADFFDGQGPYLVRAVDLAGNEDSNNAASLIDYHCKFPIDAAIVRDRGAPVADRRPVSDILGKPDAHLARDLEGPSAPPGRGCLCTATDNSSARVHLLLPVLVLVMVVVERAVTSFTEVQIPPLH